MALDLLARYAGQLAATDPGGYPYGMAQNVTAEGDGTGTPFEADLLNDILGLQQALLVAAGITPSGVPDKANASQYLTAIRWIAEGIQTTFNVKAPAFGASGLGALDDTLAIQAALNAAGAVRGRVYFPDGTYRVTAKLLVPVGVSIFGGGAAIIMKDHASAETFSWETGTDSSCGVVVADLRFEAAQNNSGFVWGISTGVVVTFVRCSINLADNKLKGQIYLSTSSAAKVSFYQCKANYNGNVLAVGISGLGELEVVGGAYSVPSNYAATSFISVDVTRVYRAKFTQLLSTTGDFGFISGSDIVVHGCVFRVTDNSAPARTYATSVGTGAKLVSSGNDFGSLASGYCYPCKNVGAGVAAGSKIQCLPLIQNATASASYTIYRSFEVNQIWSLQTTTPSLVWESPLYEGQRQELNVRNASGSDWGTSLSSAMTGPYYKSSDFGALNNGQQLSVGFVAQKLVGGALSWVQAGAAVTF